MLYVTDSIDSDGLKDYLWPNIYHVLDTVTDNFIFDI